MSKLHRCARMLCLMMASSCSLLLNVDSDQCALDSDCAARGLAGRCVAGLCESPDACVGGAAMCAPTLPSRCTDDGACRGDASDRVCWMNECASRADVGPFICGELPATQTEIVTIHVRAEEILSALPPPGLRVAACHRQDVACSAPLSQQVDTSGSGDMTLRLPTQFTGFLEVQSDRTLTMLYYLTRPVTTDTRLPTLRVIPNDIARSSAQAAGIPADIENTGTVIAQMLDCSGKPAAGVRFDLDPSGAMPFFLLNGLPSAGITETVFDPMLNNAAGGFFNAPPGVFLLTAQLGASGPTLSRYNIGVRAASVVQVDLTPPTTP